MVKLEEEGAFLHLLLQFHTSVHHPPAMLFGSFHVLWAPGMVVTVCGREGGQEAMSEQAVGDPLCPSVAQLQPSNFLPLASLPGGLNTSLCTTAGDQAFHIRVFGATV